MFNSYENFYDRTRKRWLYSKLLYPPQQSCRGGILVSPCLSICRQILCRTITWVVFLSLLKFYQLFTGEERRIPFFFDDFHFCRSRVIGLDMTENRIFTLCRMITWVVFLRMFRNFISSLPVKRGGSLSFLVGTISNVLVMEIGWTDVGSRGYILVSRAHSNTRFYCHRKFHMNWTSFKRSPVL
jgi:hypothetical protein